MRPIPPNDCGFVDIKAASDVNLPKWLGFIKRLTEEVVNIGPARKLRSCTSLWGESKAYSNACVPQGSLKCKIDRNGSNSYKFD